jgi:hypothetical protein
MLGYKIKKAGAERIIHIILEDNYWAPAPTPRPPTNIEIEQIQKRERIKKIKAILKEYNENRETTDSCTKTSTKPIQP